MYEDPSSKCVLPNFCSQFASILVDPGFSRNDPRFVGAWWLSFCITGTLLLFATLPMFLFPAEFKTASVKREIIRDRFKKSGGKSPL